MAAMTVSATAAMAAPTHRRLLDNRLRMLAVHEEGPERCPGEEHHFHNAERKAGLQHPAGLVRIVGERVVGALSVRSERPQGDPYSAPVPVSAVGIGNEAQLVDSGDEGAEKEQVHEADEGGGALGRRVSDQRVEAPEDGNRANDEKDEYVHGGNNVGFEIPIDEVGLFGDC